MPDPTLWTPEQIAADVAESTARFRAERLDEPLEVYETCFQEVRPLFEQLINSINVISVDPYDPDAFLELVNTTQAQRVLRYLTAPPISKDDLETLAETSVAPGRLRADAEAALRVRNIIRQVLDPHRFPWVARGRAPTSAEKRAAAVASAALLATRHVETTRRNNARGGQEGLVRDILIKANFAEVKRRPIAMSDDAPRPGEFCGECDLGGHKADFVVRLRDRRIMAIECKVSNSTVNSFKRLNREAVGKAKEWRPSFGQFNMVPTAVISGVFSEANVLKAQKDGLFIFWEHRIADPAIADLDNFLKAAV